MAAWPYSTAKWQKLRLAKLRSSPLCEDCRSFGRVRPASVVDHVVPIKHGGAPFPALDGLRSLCWRCHSEKTSRGVEAGAVKTLKPRRGCDANGRPLDSSHPWAEGHSDAAAERVRPSGLKPSAIPLTIVCGPPGSGKSTWVQDHASPGDIVIDLDDILVAVSGERRHAVSKRWLPKALELRNGRLRALHTERAAGRAFFIVGAPAKDERDWWQSNLGGQVVVLDVPADECLRRLADDPARAGLASRYAGTVREWWERFTFEGEVQAKAE